MRDNCADMQAAITSIYPAAKCTAVTVAAYATEQSDSEQLGHCDLGNMLGALVGAALGADIRIVGSIVGFTEGQQDSRPIGAAVEDPCSVLLSDSG